MSTTRPRTRRSTTSQGGPTSPEPRRARLASCGSLRHPFDPAILNQARQLAHQYMLVFEPDPEGGFAGSTVELPYAVAHEQTIDKCHAELMEVVVITLAAMLEDGQRPPTPARAGRREEQVNIRLTAQEKFTLEGAAQREGFRSVSDFMRAAALSKSA